MEILEKGGRKVGMRVEVKQGNRLTRRPGAVDKFFHSQGGLLKTQCFLHVSCWEGILKVSFCTAWAYSKLRKLYFVQAKRSFFFKSQWEKIGNCSSSRNSTSLQLERIFFQLCHKHAGSSSRIELVMEALCLHWNLRAHFQRFSLVPP